MARTNTLGNFLTDVADAIREKKGTNEPIPASDFDTEIENLPGGGSYNLLLENTNSYSSGSNRAGFISLFTEIGDCDASFLTNASYLFLDCYQLKTVSKLNVSKATDISGMFKNCQKLETISQLITGKPTTIYRTFNNCGKLITAPQIDTSSTTNMAETFYYCTLLANVPLYDTSSATNMQNMFQSSPALTDASLNNILQMCINATSFTGTKTLAYLGFDANNYPVSRIEGLAKYSDFTSAGWTIGY